LHSVAQCALLAVLLIVFHDVSPPMCWYDGVCIEPV